MHPNKKFFGKKVQENLVVNNIFRTFAAATEDKPRAMKLVSIAEVRMKKTLSIAQMAELVDALVSNTNTSRSTGSSPVLGTQNTMAKFLINYY